MGTEDFCLARQPQRNGNAGDREDDKPDNITLLGSIECRLGLFFDGRTADRTA